MVVLTQQCYIFDSLKLLPKGSISFWQCQLIDSVHLLIFSGQMKIRFVITTALTTEIQDKGQREVHKSQLKPVSSKPNLSIYYEGSNLGRQGNLLFGYASALGIARANNRSISFTSKFLGLKKLLPTLFLNTKNILVNDWERIAEKHSNVFDKIFVNLPQTNLIIDGYLQSYKYFENISEEIFGTFSKFNPTLLNGVERLREKLKKEAGSMLYQNITTVCVHVRRGDILKKNHYSIVKPEELHFAMNWMERRHRNVVFYIASDDLHWCRKQLNTKNVFFSNFTSAEEDFILMQSCDHMIMTVGSFGWWAAWMTSQRGGDVMAYEFLYKPESHHSVGSYFLPQWWSYRNQSVIQFRNLTHTKRWGTQRKILYFFLSSFLLY